MKERDYVISVLSEVSGIPADEINGDSMLAGDLGISSFDIADIVVTVEQKFSVHIDNDLLTDVQTVNDVLQVIEKVTGNEEA